MLADTNDCAVSNPRTADFTIGSSRPGVVAGLADVVQKLVVRIGDDLVLRTLLRRIVAGERQRLVRHVLQINRDAASATASWAYSTVVLLTDGGVLEYEPPSIRYNAVVETGPVGTIICIQFCHTGWFTSAVVRQV